jgi:hypothetical protein
VTGAGATAEVVVEWPEEQFSLTFINGRWQVEDDANASLMDAQHRVAVLNDALDRSTATIKGTARETAEAAIKMFPGGRIVN